MMRYATLVMALLPAAAVGQTVFFDDFQGNDLLPHWGQPPAHYWDYNVSDGRLTVTGLHFPNWPPSNYASISAAFEPQTDFRADVWIGWESGDAPHMLRVTVGTPTGPGNPGAIIANFGYMHEEWRPLQVYASAANQAVFIEAPPPGTHHFAVARTGRQFDFYLNGAPMASFTSTLSLPAGQIGFNFLGPFTGHFGTLHVQRISVVPAPGPMLTFGVALGMFILRHRRSNPVKPCRRQ